MNSYSMNICEYYHKCMFAGVCLPRSLARFASDRDASVVQISKDMIAVICEVKKMRTNEFGVAKRFMMVTVSEEDVQKVAESDSKEALKLLYPEFIFAGLVNAECHWGNLASKLRSLATDKLRVIEAELSDSENVAE